MVIAILQVYDKNGRIYSSLPVIVRWLLNSFHSWPIFTMKNSPHSALPPDRLELHMSYKQA